MRLDARTNAGALLETWAARHKVPYVGALRETQAYVRGVEQGLTLFDLPASKVQTDLAQWQPIIEWVDAAWHASPAKGAARAAARAPSPVPLRAASAARVPQVVRDAPQKVVRPSLVEQFGRLFAVFRSST
jgi:chromosome partitioning protein